MNYIICGFSGAGKSYLLKQLQNVTSLSSYEFIDLDQYILETYAQKFSSLGNFITQKGWDNFRKVEKEAINQLLKTSNQVISLGGGTLTSELVTTILSNSKIKALWLDTPFETCWDRIKEDTNRPLVKNGKDQCFRIYEERKKLYTNFIRIDSLNDFLNFI